MWQDVALKWTRHVCHTYAGVNPKVPGKNPLAASDGIGETQETAGAPRTMIVGMS